MLDALHGGCEVTWVDMMVEATFLVPYVSADKVEKCTTMIMDGKEEHMYTSYISINIFVKDYLFIGY